MQDKIAELEKNLNAESLRLWQHIKINPVKWSIPSGDAWVVGIMGKKVFWYNAEGNRFVVSDYTNFGKIEVVAGKIAQSDVPDTMMSLLSALRASINPS